MKFKKIFFFIILFSILITRFPVSARDKPEPAGIPELSIFYSPGCHRCNEAKEKFIPGLEKKFQGKVAFKYYDISNIENYKLLITLREKHNPKFKIVVPVFFLKGSFLNGENNLEVNLGGFIAESLLASTAAKTPVLPSVDLAGYFKQFKFFAIVSAGLIDGINPCAFTAIVFFISFLALQGYRKKDLIAIGITFIIAVFITYLLLGLGLFSFLYRIKGFWLVLRIINLTVGIFSIILGFICVYDFFKFKKDKNSEGLVLQLPASVKNQIHKVIGLHYRVNQKAGDTAFQKQTFKLVISAVITGFLVSILEAICTGQTYLPAIAFVLKTTNLKLQALFYLFIYNLMFILPLFVIFVFALYGVTSAQFSKFLKDKMLIIKILMAALFFGLGLFLIWRA